MFVNPEAVREGIQDAVMELMDGVGNYPMTRHDILDAIRQGVEDAFSSFLQSNKSSILGEGD